MKRPKEVGKKNQIEYDTSKIIRRIPNRPLPQELKLVQSDTTKDLLKLLQMKQLMKEYEPQGGSPVLRELLRRKLVLHNIAFIVPNVGYCVAGTVEGDGFNTLVCQHVKFYFTEPEAVKRIEDANNNVTTDVNDPPYTYAERAAALAEAYKTLPTVTLKYIIDRQQQEGDFYSLEMNVAMKVLTERGTPYECLE